MKHDISDRVLSLAGVFQAASLVNQIANTGMANNAVIENSLETLFKYDAESVENIFGGVAGVMHGLKTMQEQFESSRGTRDINITRYVVSLLILERKLASKTTMLDEIRERLLTIEDQLEFFSLGHENIYAKLADVYTSTVSTLGPKVMVQGEQTHLSNTHNANKVRALLLAGIRSAVSWRQCGGSRLQILFGRNKYIAHCEQLLG